MPSMSPRKWITGLLTSLILVFAALPAAAQDTTHIVAPGETLFRIALRYGVDVDTMARYNNIANAWTIYAGQTLLIPGASAAEPAAAAPVVVETTQMHTVARGENLAAIARRYGMEPAALAQLNNITNPNLIYAGQQLTITPAPAGAPAPVQAAPVQEVAAVSSYTVQPGDHLASIAERLGVSWMAIAQANNLGNANHIEVGQTLTIPSGAAANVTDFGIVTMPAAPAARYATGRSILVDLSDSRIYAYEDGRLVRNALASTGLPATPTVVGDFSVYVKHRSQTMSGPGYYLPGVEWVMYFYRDYGIHGTYWHNNFGVPMSRGCVNLPNHEAEWFYNFATIGTPVTVQY